MPVNPDNQRTRRGRSGRLRILETTFAVLLLALLLGVSLAARAAGDSDQSRVSDDRAKVLAEGERLGVLLRAAVADLHTISEDLAQAFRIRDALSDAESGSAFRFLESVLGPEPELRDLPLGVQLLQAGELRAWSGRPVPAARSRDLDADYDPQFMLRSLGVFQFLSVRGQMPGAPDWEWVLDLPLARKVKDESGGLPVLLQPARDLRLDLLPASSSSEMEASSADSLPSWTTSWKILPGEAHRHPEGFSRRWRLEQGGRLVLELVLQGPSERRVQRENKEKQRLWAGSVAFVLLLGVGLVLRQRLRINRPQGLPLAWRALLIGLLILCLRGLLIYAGIPRVFFGASEFWSPRPFALHGWGGLFASPGEFLISALAALSLLLLVLRPYLRPEQEAGDADEDLHGPSPVPGTAGLKDLPLLLLALLSPWLGVLVAASFARLVYRNSAASLLFERRLQDPELLGLSVALFFAVSFLIALFLSPAQFAWKRLPANRRLRLILSLVLLLVILWLAGPALALAFVLILPVAWGFRRATARLTGLVYHLFFIILSVTLITHDTLQDARTEHLRLYLEDAVIQQDGEIDIWQSVLIEGMLQEMGRDEGLRRELARPDRFDPLSAMALWHGSGLKELRQEGGLEIFDARGRRLSRFQWGVDLADHSPLSFSRSELPDLWVAVGGRELVQTGGHDRVRSGELVMRGPAGPLGTLVLTLVEKREGLARSLATLPWTPVTPLATGQVPASGEKPFLARIQDGRILDSSDPSLFSTGVLNAPEPMSGWQRRNLNGRNYRVALLGEGRYLAGYPETPFLDQLLAGSLRLFLHLSILFALLVIDVLFSRFTLVRRYLPPLIGPRGLGFQQKLLGAFLLVALLPTILTGIIAGRQLASQYEEASQRASLERVLAARRALENRVRQDAQELEASEYVQSFILPDFPPVPRDIGSLEQNWVMIFDAADSLILDESLRNLSPAEAREFLAILPEDRVVYEREGDRLYAGIRSPIEVYHRRQRLTGSTYYRMRLSEELLADLTGVIGGDLNLYGEGRLIHTNQPFLFGLGYQAPFLMPDEVEELFFGGVPFHQGVGRAGKLDFGYASVPLLGNEDRPVAVLSSLDFSGLSSRQNALEQGGSVVFSMIAFLIILALGLGGFLAGRVFLPIRRLQLGTRRLAAGDLSYRLSRMGRDEIGELVNSFNSMAAGLQETRRDLQERQRFLEGVLENVTSGVLSFSRDGRILSANSAARHLLGMEEEGLEACDVPALAERRTEDGLDTSPLFALLSEDLGSAATRTRELRLEHPEGARSFRVASTGLGEGRVAVFEDVTDLIRSQKLAAWGEMARQVAHEIKNPLTPIKLSVQHVQRAWRDRKPNFDEIFEDSVQTVSEQVEILRKIAQEFSLFGRRPEMRLEALDLSSAARDVLGPYAGSALELHWEEAESVTVLADAEALRKVILNLVENAREAMGEGGRLDLSCRAVGSRAELRLRDYGPGIPVDALDRLFEPYFSSKTGGTGLGLAISAQFVEEMDGSLRLENHPEGGAVAFLGLPLAHPAD